MENLNIKDYLYHGIVYWLFYDKNGFREKFCLNKLASILEKRLIVIPCDIKKIGITHNDTANPYTFYFTFLACSSKSIYASRFKKTIKDDKGYTVAASYSRFGVLFNPGLLNELTISDVSFCDKEIVIEDNISLDKYGIGIYINPIETTEESFQTIKQLVNKHNYEFNVVSVFDGMKIESLSKEKERVKRFALKL